MHLEQNRSRQIIVRANEIHSNTFVVIISGVDKFLRECCGFDIKKFAYKY